MRTWENWSAYGHPNCSAGKQSRLVSQTLSLWPEGDPHQDIRMLMHCFVLHEQGQADSWTVASKKKLHVQGAQKWQSLTLIGWRRCWPKVWLATVAGSMALLTYVRSPRQHVLRAQAVSPGRSRAQSWLAQAVSPSRSRAQRRLAQSWFRRTESGWVPRQTVLQLVCSVSDLAHCPQETDCVAWAWVVSAQLVACSRWMVYARVWHDSHLVKAWSKFA